jgi:hypothetical protein
MERKSEATPAPAPATGEDELIPLIGDGNLAAAVTWMIRNSWITSEQAMGDSPFAALKPEHRAKIKARPQAFVRAITTGGAK